MKIKTILQNIFSVTNRDSHKVITIIGFKIKLKRNTNNQKSDLFTQTEIPVIELFFMQFKDYKFNRLDTIVRLLAIENYYNKNDYGWDLYNKMQDLRIGTNYSIESKEKFIKLIENWEKNGYNSNSAIDVNSNIEILDGSHRLALAIYHNLKNIRINIRSDNIHPKYGIEWFIEKDFTEDEIKHIINKYNEVLAIYNNGVNISCILWAPVEKYFDEITNKINIIYHVKEVVDNEFSDDTYNRMVKAIYTIDDIEDWKVEKKLEYMQSYFPKKIRYISLHIDRPKFRFKALNNKTILVQGEELKRILRNCYKNKINNYFYDILVHTSDNTTQYEYINKLFHSKINLSEYFDKIAKFNWMIIKFEPQNLTSDFPKNIPFSKDVDIVCSKTDFQQLKNTSINYLKSTLYNYYEINVIDKDLYNTQIRIELRKFLIFLIDITCDYDDNNNLIENSLDKRIKIKNYYVPQEKDELCFRILEYNKYPHKIHHYNYIKDKLNKEYIDYIKKYIPSEIVDKYYGSQLKKGDDNA